MSPARTPRVVVVGDTLLDRDVEGTTSRRVPDGGAPVVDVDACTANPGGAGLAALLAARHGVHLTLVTALGTDSGGKTLRDMLCGTIDVVALRLDGTTPCKMRILAGSDTVVRVDSGRGAAAHSTPDAAAMRVLRNADAVLVSDYGRGVTTIPWVRAALADGVARGIPTVWDPHPRGGVPVEGTTLLTPNTDEAADHGLRWDNETFDLPPQWSGCRSIVVTCGVRGATLLDTEGVSHFAVPPGSRFRRRAPIDTCGAGDAFAAAATVALSRSRDLRGAVASAVDTATAAVLNGGPKSLAGVRCSHGDWPGALDGSPAGAPRTVATGGCFDLLHRGHIALLREARALGDRLVVCLNSDDSVRRAKGPDRPFVSAHDRALVLGALDCVDEVIVFDDDTPERLLGELRPDVWVKGDDYDCKSLPEAAVVRRHGGEIVFVSRVPGYSTSELARAVGIASARAS